MKQARGLRRAIGPSLVAAAGILTLILAARTFWYLFHSITNVPYGDQWVMLDEIRKRQAGLIGWNYLWSPYWGQRLLLPRLLFLFSAKYLHYAMLPFILINVTAQLAMLAVLIRTARRHLRGLLLFCIAALALAHLLLSSLQMEILVEGIEVQYTIGFAAAVAAICARRFWASLVLAAVSTLCLAVGPLVWPILALEAWMGGRKWRASALAVTAALIGFAYSMGYTRPSIGMGLAGMLRHPWQAFTITGLVLGGPASLYARPFGTLVGCAGIVFAGVILVDAWRRRKPMSFVLVFCFMGASAAAIAFGRLSPEWLASYHGLPLPSRYLAPTFVFWAALFTAALICWPTARIVTRAATIGTWAAVLLLTFGTWNWQWRMPREWATVSQGFDAIASGFFLPVSDQEYMSRIFPVEDLRTSLAGYMRDRRLGVFAEPRADWLGKNIAALAPPRAGHACQAAVRENQPLGGSPPVYRIVGSLTVGRRAPSRSLDVLMTDSQGVVTGLARTLPAQSEGAPATDFFGYARGHPARLVLLGGRSCETAW